MSFLLELLIHQLKIVRMCRTVMGREYQWFGHHLLSIFRVSSRPYNYVVMQGCVGWGRRMAYDQFCG